jgi:hypothetical protein
MSYFLFLDDERNPRNVTWMQTEVYFRTDWKIVRNYRDFVDMITEYGLPGFVSFDHDLADFHYQAMLEEVNGKQNVNYGPEKTGFDCAKWLVDYCTDNAIEFPAYMVHSMNPIGKERIVNYVEQYKGLAS